MYNSFIPRLSSRSTHTSEKMGGRRDKRWREPGKYYHMLKVEATLPSTLYMYKKRGVVSTWLPSRDNTYQALPVFCSFSSLAFFMCVCRGELLNKGSNLEMGPCGTSLEVKCFVQNRSFGTVFLCKVCLCKQTPDHSCSAHLAEVSCTGHCSHLVLHPALHKPTLLLLFVATKH